MLGKDAGALPHGGSGVIPASRARSRGSSSSTGAAASSTARATCSTRYTGAYLPSVALESSAELARHLLSDGRQWSRDVFDHTPRPASPGWPDRQVLRTATQALAGDTLVIVRNSRGVQVGDGNTQHNDFQIRITNVAVKAVQAGPAGASRAAVDQLCQHPSQAAAEAVAGQIAHAARDHLVLDLTAQVTREIGSPVISASQPRSAGRPEFRRAGPPGPT